MLEPKAQNFQRKANTGESQKMSDYAVISDHFVVWLKNGKGGKLFSMQETPYSVKCNKSSASGLCPGGSRIRFSHFTVGLKKTDRKCGQS